MAFYGYETLSLGTVTQLFGIGHKTMRKLIKEGKVNCIQNGGVKQVFLEDVANYWRQRHTQDSDDILRTPIIKLLLRFRSFDKDLDHYIIENDPNHTGGIKITRSQLNEYIQRAVTTEISAAELSQIQDPSDIEYKFLSIYQVLDYTNIPRSEISHMIKTHKLRAFFYTNDSLVGTLILRHDMLGLKQ